MTFFKKTVLFALMLHMNSASGKDNCGWKRQRNLTNDGALIPVEISNKNYGAYRDNVTCSIEIVYLSSWRSRHLKVEVDSFDLKGSSATGHICLVESERLTLQIETDTGLESVTWCGQLYAEQHVFPSSKLTLIYNSGLIGQGKGFKLNVSLVLVSSSTDINIKANEQPRLLYSPKFPDKHDNNIKNYLMSLEAEHNHFILIRILMIDLESFVVAGCRDYLKINGDYFCDNPSDVLVKDSVAEMEFYSDSDINGRGYILEYSSYAVGDLSNASRATEDDPEEIDHVPKLFHISGSRLSWHFVAKRESHTLHIEIVDVANQFLTLFADSGSNQHFAMHNVKHYWSKKKGVKIVNLSGSGFMYVLVRSVPAGHSIGLFRAEVTIAWLKWDFNEQDKRDFKVYLPKNSNYNIGVMIDSSMRNGLTVSNGPTTDYFDIVKGCKPEQVNQTEFISWNTKIVTIELSPSLWQRGVPIIYFPTVKTAPYIKVNKGTYSLIDADQNLRNLFCFLEVGGGTDYFTKLEAQTNLDVSDSVILKHKKVAYPTTVVARLAELEKSEVQLQFKSPDTVQIDVTIPDPSKISVKKPEVSIDVTQESNYLRCFMGSIYPSSAFTQSVSAPPFLILAASSLDCTWDVAPLEESGFVKITVFSLPYTPANAHSCAYLEIQSLTQRSMSSSINICAPQDGDPLTHDLYLEGPGIIKLKRQVWLELPEPLFTYTVVTSLDVSTSVPGNYMNDFCPPEVIIGGDVEFSFTSQLLNQYSTNENAIYCEIRILPKFYDSVTFVNVNELYNMNRDFYITITGYDPSDQEEHPIKEVKVTRPFISQSFRHMALKITATVNPSKGDNFNIHFRLIQETICNENEYPLATEDFQYIVSPNYPYPFPGGLYCEWRFNQIGPIYFELVEYQGSRTCVYDSLDVIFGDYSDSQRTRFCGLVDENQVLKYDEGSYLWQTVTIRFRSKTNSEGYKGFMLRYKLKEASDDNYGGNYDHSSSGNKTGVAVGTSIASILFLLIIGAAVAVFVTHRRRIRFQHRQRNRRELVRNWRQQRSNSASSATPTPSVFVVGSMIVNTNSPPPPYPGLPQNFRGSAESGGYITNSGGDYINSAHRGNGAQNAGIITAARTHSDYAELEPPPPYHPLMPGSPYSSEEHNYHPLANPRDSGIAMSSTTLYSMAQSSSSVNPNEDDTRISASADYSLASTPENSEARGEVRTTERVREDRPADYDNLAYLPDNNNEGPVYSVASNLQDAKDAPPSYEDSNPPHPPPSYELATFPSSESAGGRVQGRGPQARNGHLGPL